jgi:energy-coupling factor transport system permease protein
LLVAGSSYVPATLSDLSHLRDAARLRGITLDGPPWKQLGGWRRLLVPLLVSTVRRGLQLGEAMEARAFGATRSRTQRRILRWRLADTVALLAAALYLILVAAVEVWLSAPR